MPVETTESMTARMEELTAQLKAAREERITARLDALIAENPGLSREDWLPRVLAD